MTKTFLQFILLYIVMVLAQVIIFNHLCLFNVAIPLAFIYFILRLPVSLGINWVMTVSFIMGLTIDIFSDTLGMNALACTLLAVMRLPVLRLYFPREEDLTDPRPSTKSLGLGVYIKYAMSMSVIYCTLFFIIEAFTFFNPLKLVLRIVTSSLLTFLFLLCIDSLITRRSEKRL